MLRHVSSIRDGQRILTSSNINTSHAPFRQTRALFSFVRWILQCGERIGGLASMPSQAYGGGKAPTGRLYGTVSPRFSSLEGL